MKRVQLVIIFTILVMAGLPAVALAKAGPLERIQNVIEEGRAYIIANKADKSEAELASKLKEIVAPTFDFKEMAKRCLGSNWNAGTPEQQQEFVDLFSEMLADSYMKKIIKSIDTAEIKYPPNGVEVVGTKASVKTIVSADGETASIEYRLLQRTDSSWWTYDVVIENIGLVSNYRTEFSDIIRRNGFDGLIKMLKERIEKMKTTDEKKS